MSFGERASLVIAHRLLDLLARIHHERTVLDDGLEQGAAGEQECAASFAATGQLDRIAVSEHRRDGSLVRAACRADRDAPFEGMTKAW
jgi:hypothetical protein